MNKIRHIDEWITELEFGRLPQGRGKLCTKSGGHCCIGVYVRMLAERWPAEFRAEGIRVILSPSSITVTPPAKEGSTAFIPENDSFIPYELQMQLAEFNDAGRSFIWIAQLLRQLREVGSLAPAEVLRTASKICHIISVDKDFE